MGSLPDADKASDKAVFEKAREAIVAEVRGKLGERLANSSANALKLKRIKEHRQSHPKEEAATPAPQASKEDRTTMKALSRLADNAPRRLRFIKNAMGSLPEDKTYDVHALQEKARELIKPGK